MSNNFGWNPKVHESITRLALEHVPVKLPHTESIIEGVIDDRIPLHLFGILDAKHCYAGEPLSSPSSRVKHSLDMYIDKLIDSMIDWELDNENAAMKEIGEAVHLLQDIADPLHTRKFYVSPLKFQPYRKYYKCADKIDISEIITEKELNAVTDNFYDLYGDTYIKARRSPYPLRSKYIARVPELMKKSISNACASTVAFLKRLGNLHTMSDAYKTDAFASEQASSKFLQKIREKNS